MEMENVMVSAAEHWSGEKWSTVALACQRHPYLLNCQRVEKLDCCKNNCFVRFLLFSIGHRETKTSVRPRKILFSEPRVHQTSDPANQMAASSSAMLSGTCSVKNAESPDFISDSGSSEFVDPCLFTWSFGNKSESSPRTLAETGFEKTLQTANQSRTKSQIINKHRIRGCKHSLTWTGFTYNLWRLLLFSQRNRALDSKTTPLCCALNINNNAVHFSCHSQN